MSQEKEENQQYQLSSVEEKIGIVIKILFSDRTSPYLMLQRDVEQRIEIQSRITKFIKENSTERSTIMVPVNQIIIDYMDEKT